MKFSSAPIEGVSLIDLEPRADDRGMFARAWCAAEFRAVALAPEIEQINVSTNHRRGTIRGLHRQTGEHAEAKTFRCIAGRTFHVAVDLRPGSPTFGRWFGAELAAEAMNSLHIPAGCAAGYQALEDGAAVLYLSSTAYAAGSEEGFRFDDPSLGIDWPILPAIVSEKDRLWPLLDLSLRGAHP